MRQLKFVMILAMVCCRQAAFGQFTDSFSDGEFMSAPPWQGDDARFGVVGNRLRLQAPAQSGTASLATRSKAVHGASWMFYVQMDFTPSGTNYAKVYLMADQPALGSSVSGYFVKIGGTTREVSLYKQTGTTELEVVDGLDERLNLGTVTAAIRVLRSEAGTWELHVDMGRTGTYQKEGEAIDLTHTTSAWFGIHCVYTSTRADKFWFDDIVVEGTPVPDTRPPDVVQVNAPEPTRVVIQFSEPVNPATLNSNITLEGVGYPMKLNVSPDSLAIDAHFSTPLVNGYTYMLRIAGVQDMAGNSLQGSWPVMYFKPGTASPKSVIITELLADPYPQVGLPAAEYIEVFNRTAEPLDLANWSLTDGSSTGILDRVILLPQTYLILTSTASVALFPHVQVIGLANFPSLNNAGDRLYWRNAEGEPIDSVHYSSSWFGDEDKEQGGWALELIDTDNPCGENRNWAPSEDSSGGTPGKRNSVAANKPDVMPPNLLGITPTPSGNLMLQFDELLQEPEGAECALDPFVPLASMRLAGEGKREIEIVLLDSLTRRTVYTISIAGIRDCAGNRISEARLEFGVAEAADSGDVVVSEILFNPRTGGADFVELYNRSEKFLQLEGWQLSNESDGVSLPAFLLHPGRWVALTEDPVAVMWHYPSSNSQQLVQTRLPSLPDEEGRVVVCNATGRRMDSVDYRDDWHSVFLNRVEGVSLERLDLSGYSHEAANWSSASAHAGFATPGQANSQQAPMLIDKSEVDVTPEVLVRGGAEEYVLVRYHFDKGGMANVNVLAHNGTVIKPLAENEWLGSDGFLRWEGDRADGQRAPAGYYVIWFEWFDPQGQVLTYRKRVVVAAR